MRIAVAAVLLVLATCGNAVRTRGIDWSRLSAPEDRSKEVCPASGRCGSVLGRYCAEACECGAGLVCDFPPFAQKSVCSQKRCLPKQKSREQQVLDFLQMSGLQRFGKAFSVKRND